MSSVRRLEVDEVRSLRLVPTTPPAPRWTAEEDEVLQTGYAWGAAPALAAQLGRSVQAIRQRARTLGLAGRQQARITWTSANDALLRAEYGRVPTAELAARLGTTVGAVWAQAKKLGVATRLTPQRPWTAEEDHLLRELAGAAPRAVLAARLGRTAQGISGRMQTLGLQREALVATRYARDTRTITQLRAEIAKRDAQRPLDADARRLAVLIGYRMSVISANEAAVVLGVPVERLPVELGKAAARGLDVVRDALGEGGT